MAHPLGALPKAAAQTRLAAVTPTAERSMPTDVPIVAASPLGGSLGGSWDLNSSGTSETL